MTMGKEAEKLTSIYSLDLNCSSLIHKSLYKSRTPIPRSAVDGVDRFIMAVVCLFFLLCERYRSSRPADLLCGS